MSQEPPAPGTVVEVDVGPVAHGGHWVARHEGRVLFVRHALEGERVRARVTEVGGAGRFLRADAVEVLSASPHRVPPPCRFAGPGGCGGCDFQHVSLDHQRVLKAAVVREQLARLAGLDVDVHVEPVPGDQDGLRWRTRVEFAVDGRGRAGLRRHRSHDVVPLDDCLIATEAVVSSGVLGEVLPGAEAVDVVAPTGGPGPVVVRLPEDAPSAPTVDEVAEVGGRTWRYAVAARGFWQVHRGAAATFVGAVLDAARPEPGERVLDLYAGVGLFSLPLADAVGQEGHVIAVEGDRAAVRHARANLADRPGAQVRRARVDRFVRRLASERRDTDLVVLDPPRSGARAAVVRDVAALSARRIVYVACDPAALARDTAYLGEEGYRLAALRAFDAFPMTHHVECVATFEAI